MRPSQRFTPESSHPGLLWVHKNAKSASLSHSHDTERLQILRQAQQSSRRNRSGKSPKGSEVRHGSVEQGSVASRSTDGIVGNLPQYSRVDAALPLDPSCSAEERRALDFFRSATLSKIISIGREALFWQEHVLCLSILNPAFRHMVVAIAATHELLAAEDAEQLHILALTQCNIATKLLRNNHGSPPELLASSCVLMAAYHLLRGELANADAFLNTGFKLVAQSRHGFPDQSYSWEANDTRKLLERIRGKLGYALWAHDIVFQFERSPVAADQLNIELLPVKGPFTSIEQAFTSYRCLVTEVVTKLTRNLAAHAHLDPDCLLAREASRHFSVFAFWWETYCSQQGVESLDQRLEMLQLNVGYLYIWMLFQTRVISPSENTLKSRDAVFKRILDLCQEILEAHYTGQEVQHLDQIVNGAILFVGISGLNSVLRRRAVKMLQSQVKSDQALPYWIRGVIIELLVQAEEHLTVTAPTKDMSLPGRIGIEDLSCCDSDRRVTLRYTHISNEGDVKTDEQSIDWDDSFGSSLSSQTIHASCQRFIAGYRMYGKPSLTVAPLGYLREIWFRGRPMPVHLHHAEI